MPLYRSDHVEYNIESGHIQITNDDGKQVPAYWAHPARGNKFPGIALVHSWWGITDIIRRMAHLYAQMGFYVIIPDLFRGSRPKTYTRAMEEVQKLDDNGFFAIDAVLSVLETHHMCNAQVAAVGIGMGGSLAYEAAIKRRDLEAAVSFYGFPQGRLGRFGTAQTPIMGIYGTEDSFVRPVVVRHLEKELKATPLADQHHIIRIQGAKHDFVVDNPTPEQRQHTSTAWQSALDFIELHIKPPENPHKHRRVM